MYFEIKDKFLKFFEKRGHKIIPSSSLIPQNDPSVLLTTAGMQQFKEYFLGTKNSLNDFQTQRVTSCQKCFRTTDIEEVGDERHLTFFEMLGNFSFGPVTNDDPNDFNSGGYFKKSAIFWAFQFLTQELNLQIDYVTFFAGENDIPADKESYQILKELGFSDEKIKPRGKEDNFWGPTGESGPCGPTVEFYIDDIEVWNLVFNEYFQNKEGKLAKLQNPGVDTGMGYERLLKVVEKKETIFETSAFNSIYRILKPLVPQEKQNNIRDQRIILDHLRAIIFLIADGVLPSNVLQGYVLRRIIRRFLLKFNQLSLPVKSLKILFKETCNFYSQSYPEVGNFEKIYEVFEEEKGKFELTLERGLRIFEKNKDKIINENSKAKNVFLLYTSYGFPIDLSKELLYSLNITWTADDEKELQNLIEEHKKISKNIQ